MTSNLFFYFMNFCELLVLQTLEKCCHAGHVKCFKNKNAKIIILWLQISFFFLILLLTFLSTVFKFGRASVTFLVGLKPFRHVIEWSLCDLPEGKVSTTFTLFQRQSIFPYLFLVLTIHEIFATETINYSSRWSDYFFKLESWSSNNRCFKRSAIENRRKESINISPTDRVWHRLGNVFDGQDSYPIQN